MKDRKMNKKIKCGTCRCKLKTDHAPHIMGTRQWGPMSHHCDYDWCLGVGASAAKVVTWGSANSWTVAEIDDSAHAAAMVAWNAGDLASAKQP